MSLETELRVRVSSTLKTALEDRAAAEGIAVSALARRALLLHVSALATGGVHSSGNVAHAYSRTGFGR